MEYGSVITYADNLAVGAGETKVVHVQAGTTHDLHVQYLMQTSTQADAQAGVVYADALLTDVFGTVIDGTGTDNATIIKSPYSVVIVGGAAPAVVTLKAVIMPLLKY